MGKRKYYEWHKPETGYMDVLNPFLKSNMVLDVGCGSGWVGEYLGRINKDVNIFSLDLDLNGLKSDKNNENPILGDANRLPFKDITFDGVIAKDLIEHMMDPLSMILEFNRVLKVGGKIFISVPDVKSKTFWDDYTHIRPFNKNSLIHLAEDGGFTVEQLWYSGNWPGIGIIMRILNMKKLPYPIKFLAKLGVNRQNVQLIATKY